MINCVYVMLTILYLTASFQATIRTRGRFVWTFAIGHAPDI